MVEMNIDYTCTCSWRCLGVVDLFVVVPLPFYVPHSFHMQGDGSGSNLKNELYS